MAYVVKTLLNKNNQAKLDSDLLILGAGCRDSLSEADIDNINLSYVQPMIMKAADDVSKTTLSGTFVPPDDVNITYEL